MALFGKENYENLEKESQLYDIKLEVIAKYLRIFEEKKSKFNSNFNNKDAAFITKRLLEEAGISSKILEKNKKYYLQSSMEKEKKSVLSEENEKILVDIKRELANLKNKGM